MEQNAGHWTQQLSEDPISPLLSANQPALEYFARRDLLGQKPGSVETLWELPPALKILSRQQENGSWRYPGANRQRYPEIYYDLLETFRQLGILVVKYGLDNRHPAIEKAAAYLFSCQTDEGDIRGILGTQYMPYYHAVIAELLIKAGYGDHPRLETGLRWLLSMRQDDGGWIVPLQAVPPKEKTRHMWSAPPVQPDRSRPFSHLATGMVLRAFALHPSYRQREEVTTACDCLKSRFFRSDKYNDRQAPRYWYKFQFPFWWTNLLTALDTLSLIGYSRQDQDVHKALRWFVDNQQPDGLWKTSYEQAKHKEPTAREQEARRWVSLAICRVLKRLAEVPLEGEYA
jgi:hypothetical protein